MLLVTWQQRYTRSFLLWSFRSFLTLRNCIGDELYFQSRMLAFFLRKGFSRRVVMRLSGIMIKQRANWICSHVIFTFMNARLNSWTGWVQLDYSAVEFVDFVCSAQNVLLILTLGTMAKVAAPAAILVHQVYVTLEFLMTTLCYSVLNGKHSSVLELRS